MSHSITCDCPRCDGSGEITCPDCDGQGNIAANLCEMVIAANHPRRAELLELQKDCRRVTKQGRRLMELRPDREAVYAEQLHEALDVIQGQALKLLKP